MNLFLRFIHSLLNINSNRSLSRLMQEVLNYGRSFGRCFYVQSNIREKCLDLKSQCR